MQRASVWGFNPNHVIKEFCDKTANYDNKAVRYIVVIVVVVVVVVVELIFVILKCFCSRQRESS